MAFSYQKKMGGLYLDNCVSTAGIIIVRNKNAVMGVAIVCSFVCYLTTLPVSRLYSVNDRTINECGALVGM
jgi:hypothetical protein